MPKKNEHRDVFLRVRIYEKCSSHNHKRIKQHSNQTNTPRAIPSVIIILPRLLVRSEGVLLSKNEVFLSKFPVFLLVVPVGWSCSCLVFSCWWFLVLLPGPGWSCLVRPAWSCLVRLGPSWSCLVTWPAVSCWFFFPRFNNTPQLWVVGNVLCIIYCVGVTLIFDGIFCFVLKLL